LKKSIAEISNTIVLSPPVRVCKNSFIVGY
jgi:hypothetical protein